jgi:general secretion pathway protein L
MRPELERALDALYGALNWWFDGLWIGLPASARRLLFTSREHIGVRLTGSIADITVSGQSVAAVDTANSAAVDAARATLTRRHAPDVTLFLDRTQVLTRTLRLPSVATGELRGLVLFEIDRLTPFTTDDVVFDYHLRGRSDAGLVIDILLVRKAALQAALKCVEALGLTPTKATLEEEGAPAPFNLLPRRRHLRLPVTTLSVRPVWAISALLMTAIALYLPLVHYGRVLTKRTTAVQSARADAVASRTRLSEEEAAMARADFLSAKRHGYVRPIVLLKDLTARIPDDTWVSRLAINRDELQLQGESAAATDLLATLEASDLVEAVRFQAPVARSEDGVKERFAIVGTLTRGAP